MKRLLFFCAMCAFLPFAYSQDGNPVSDLNWIVGPVKADLGDTAEIDVPQGYGFLDGDNTRKFLELNENMTNGSEVGTVMPEDGGWFVIFEYEDTGYVKDDDKEDLDAAKMLKVLREAAEAGNRERRKRGWAEMTPERWFKAPAYNETTHNLEWAPVFKVTSGEDEGETVNYNTRLLGRHGIMSVTLVMGPEQGAIVPEYQKLISGFSYKKGSTYAEWREGDKVAEYGLSALVAGGSLALAAKVGILQKFWKLILAGLVAVGAFFKRFYRKLAGKE